MRREFVVLILFSVLLTNVSCLNVNARVVLSVEVTVPDQYPTIQAAINNASEGDTVLVGSGIYHEHVVVNKSVSLIGEDAGTTIIDGDDTGHVVHVIRNNTNITGFTIRNSGHAQVPDLDAGICLNTTTGCIISENQVMDNGFCGISLLYSSNNTIIHNNLSGPGWSGIHLLSSTRNTVSGNIITDKYGGVNGHVSSNYNNITENVISNCTYGGFYHAVTYNSICKNNISDITVEGIWLQDQANYNVVAENNFINNNVAIRLQGPNYYNTLSRNVITGAEYAIKIQNNVGYTRISHNIISMNNYGFYVEYSTQNLIYGNNIVSNGQQSYVTSGSANTWDDGPRFGGNYWSDYNGTDINGDGKGDTPYAVDATNEDRYPLINPFSGIVVPDQYPTIQAAVNRANDHDTIFVRTGTYYEHLVVNRTVALVGENRDTTIVDGSYIGIVVNVTRDGISISGFTIRNSGTTWNIGGPPYGAGIYMRNVTGCRIYDNKMIQDAAAIQLEYEADDNIIANNTISTVGLGFGALSASWNIFSGNNVTSNGRGLGINVNSDYNVISNNIITAPEWVIALHACHYNNITMNHIANGQIGIYLPDSSDTRLYHNTIVNNSLQASTTYGQFTTLHNYWDNGYPSGGNYWSNYHGADFHSGTYQNETGCDKRGDSPYAIDSINADNYPLIKPILRLIHGDVNYDGKADPQDLEILAQVYGSKPGDLLWNPNADIDDNDRVGLSDLVILAQQYGQHYP